jgi:hypothetical protein
MRTTDTRLPHCLTQISDVGLSYLADMPSLCVADVRGCFRVTVGGAAALRHRTGTLGTVPSGLCHPCFWQVASMAFSAVRLFTGSRMLRF